MNLLIINLDKGIFSESSSSLERLVSYSKLVDKLFVIVWTRGDEEPIVVDNKLFIYPTNSKSKLNYLFDTFSLVSKIFKKNKIDLVSTQDPFETGLVGWLVSIFKKTKLQLQVHTDFLSPYFARESILNRFRVLLAKFLIPRSSGVRVVSERIKKSITLKIKVLDKKIKVLPIFVDVKKIKKSAVKSRSSLHKKYSQFDFIILMASRFSKEKNIKLAICAMGEVVERYPKTGLIIVGEGTEKGEYEETIEEFNLGDNIVIEGWVDNLSTYYKTADLFLLTSNYEGYGLTVIEAMSAGCPIVVSDVGIAGSLLKNGENGIIVPVGNKRSFIEAIVHMIRDKTLRRRLSSSAQEITEILQTKKEYLQEYKKGWEKCLT